MEQRASTAVLLISCADRSGIVAAVSSFIAEHGGNIVDLQQHSDSADGVFFQRAEFTMDGDDRRAELRQSFARVASQFDMSWRLRLRADVPRLALLASREAHCLHDVLNRWRAGELRVDIPVVISNHPEHEPLARWYGVEFRYLPAGPDMAAQEDAVEAALRSHGVELVVLARYMRVLSAAFCGRWAGQVINIHHGLLPSFQGPRPYHQARDRGVKLIGATAHYATAELDAGPIIEQDVLRINHRDSVDDLRRKGRDLEVIVLARAIRAHIEHRTLVYGARTIVFDG